MFVVSNFKFNTMEKLNDMKNSKSNGAIFAGFMFIGMGIGWLFGEIAIGMFIGMGVGFLAKVALNKK